MEFIIFQYVSRSTQLNEYVILYLVQIVVYLDLFAFELIHNLNGSFDLLQLELLNINKAYFFSFEVSTAVSDEGDAYGVYVDRY